MEPAVQFQADFTYEGQEQPALRAVSGTIEAGKCVVLCGSSGCGKSTLLRCLNQLIPQFYEGELTGFRQIRGQNLESLSIGETGKLAASVFQDPRSQFFTLNSNTEIALGPENFGLSHSEITDRVDRAFGNFHMEKLRNRNVFALSSGERQLIAVLSAWAMDTEILLLDEPTANLDYAAIQKLADVLKVLKNKGKTLLISEHRLSYLRDVADEYWRMDGGEVTERYSREAFLSLTQNELQELGLRTTDPYLIHSALKPLPPPIRSDVLRIENITFRYHRGEQAILDGFFLDAHTGEVIGLIGANGCGKTTLGKVTAGLMDAECGSISLNSQRLSGRALSDCGIFIMQEAEFQFFTNSVWNELHYGMDHSKEKEAEIESLLKQTGLWEFRDRHPFSLSGGQMQKLVMLLACLSSKPIVILDEPTAGLDYRSLTICADLIRRMQRDRIVLLISHDPELLSMVCTRAVCLDRGKVNKAFDLSEPEAFEALKMQMHCLAPTGNPVEYVPKPVKHRLDPRTKLLLLLIAMIAGVGTDLPLIGSVLLVLAVAAGYEQKWKLLVSTGALMGLVEGLYWLHPTVATSFLASFFPRMILIGFGAALMMAADEGPRILAGLRALHVPERVNMIVSVVLRFFPVLHGDLSILSQSIRTRGFFRSFGQKLRSAPEYLEILIVPMVFRVLRIAEALSASAETRGISLPGKRDSYVSIRWSSADTVISALLVISVLTGIFVF